MYRIPKYLREHNTEFVQELIAELEISPGQTILDHFGVKQIAEITLEYVHKPLYMIERIPPLYDANDVYQTFKSYLERHKYENPLLYNMDEYSRLRIVDWIWMPSARTAKKYNLELALDTVNSPDYIEDETADEWNRSLTVYHKKKDYIILIYANLEINEQELLYDKIYISTKDEPLIRAFLKIMSKTFIERFFGNQSSN